MTALHPAETHRLFEHDRVCGAPRPRAGGRGRRYPRPASRDPTITPGEAARHGFAAPVHRDFASAASFTAREYAAFLMTESNVIAAIEYGSEDAARVRAWLESELLSLFGEESRPVAFAGYVQALRRS